MHSTVTCKLVLIVKGLGQTVHCTCAQRTTPDRSRLLVQCTHQTPRIKL